MKHFIKFGYGLTAITWAVMLFNVFVPFEGNIQLLLWALLLITSVMHGLQVLIFHTMFSQQLTLKTLDYLTVFCFGIFGLLHYRQRVIDLGK